MLERILQLAQDPLASIVFRATWTWGNRPSIVPGIDMSLNLIGCARRVILNCDRPSLASIVFHALWIWGNRQSVDCVWISLAVIVLNEKAVLHHVNRLAMFKALLLGPKSWSTWNCGRKLLSKSAVASLPGLSFSFALFSDQFLSLAWSNPRHVFGALLVNDASWSFLLNFPRCTFWVMGAASRNGCSRFLVRKLGGTKWETKSQISPFTSQIRTLKFERWRRFDWRVQKRQCKSSKIRFDRSAFGYYDRTRTAKGSNKTDQPKAILQWSRHNDGHRDPLFVTIQCVISIVSR